MEIYRHVNKTSLSRFLKTCLQDFFGNFENLNWKFTDMWRPASLDFWKLAFKAVFVSSSSACKSVTCQSIKCEKAFEKHLKSFWKDWHLKRETLKKACHQMRWHKKTDFQNTFALIWWGKNGRKKHKDKLHPNNHSWTKFTNVAERLQRRCKWWRIFVLTISEFWVDSKYWRQDQD